jgi:hypothetical protein
MNKQPTVSRSWQEGIDSTIHSPDMQRALKAAARNLMLPFNR